MKFNGIATCSHCKQSYECECATPVKDLTSSRRIEFIDSANRKPGTAYLKLVTPYSEETASLTGYCPNCQRPVDIQCSKRIRETFLEGI